MIRFSPPSVTSDANRVHHAATALNAEQANTWQRLSLVGPMLVGLVIGLNCAFWAFGHWLQRSPAQSVAAQLTLVGSAYQKPDFDFLIYMLGLLLGVSLALSLSAIWHRRFGRAAIDGSVQRLRVWALLHLPMALFLVLLRLIRLDLNMLSLLSAALGILWCAFALWATRKPEHRRPVVRSRPAARLASPLHVASWSARTLPVSVEIVLISALIVLLVWVPRSVDLVAQSFMLDHFYHPDFYAMAPALAFRHGLALGTDFYSQYGVGWPMILALFSKIQGYLSYRLFFELSIAWGCIYFLSAYLLLRVLLRNVAWAIGGLLLAVALSLLAGNLPGTGKWLLPSSTAMRYAMDMLCFTTMLIHARTGRWSWALLTGAGLGFQLLLAIDTGLYLLIVFLAYAALVCLPRTSLVGKLSGIRYSGVAVATFAAVAVAGLTLASRGTVGTSAFWLGATEALRVFGGGFSHEPAGKTLAESWSAYLLLMVMLLTYLLALSRTIQALALRRLTPEALVLGLVSLYGLEMLLLFVGRSLPSNLYNTSVPFCIVLTGMMARFCTGLGQLAADTEGTRAKLALQLSSRYLPACLALLFAVVLGSSPAFHRYPNLLHTQPPAQSAADSSTNPIYLFAAHREGRLGLEWADETRRFHAIVNTLRQLSDGGRNTVALIGLSDTAFLVEADLPPYFRYSPVLMNLVFQHQVQDLLHQLTAHPPEYLMLPITPPKRFFGVLADDTHSQIMAVAQRHFAMDHLVEDLAVYRRLPNR